MWLTADSEELVELWPGSVDLSPVALGIILEAAAIQCEAYLAERYQAVTSGALDWESERARWREVLADWTEGSEPLPRTWIYAQALQAKALSTSGIAGADDSVGGFGETVTVFPMDWTVKNLLRPKGRISVA